MTKSKKAALWLAGTALIIALGYKFITVAVIAKLPLVLAVSTFSVAMPYMAYKLVTSVWKYFSQKRKRSEVVQTAALKPQELDISSDVELVSLKNTNANFSDKALIVNQESALQSIAQKPETEVSRKDIPPPDPETVSSLVNATPMEVKARILSFLSARDLVYTQLTSKEWYSVSTDQTVWRELIIKHFPYLADTNQPEFKNDPHGLYCQECKNYRNLITSKLYDFTLKELLASLEGDLNTIAAYKGYHQYVLYSYAVANGHDSALKKECDKKLAVELAAQNGNLNVVTHLLQNPDLSVHARWALTAAAEEGHLPIVTYLLESATNISAEDISNAFKKAFSKGSPCIVYFLTVLAISAEDKGWALKVTADCGQIDLLKYLLQVGPDISHADKIFAFKSAANKGYTSIVKHMMETSIFSADNKMQAFNEASQKDRLDVVKYMLETTIFTATNKGNALILAAKNGSINVAAYLLNAASDISSHHKDMALISSASGGYLTLVQILIITASSTIKGKALVGAVMKNHAHIVEYILNHYSHCIVSEHKKQAMDYAKQIGCSEIVKIISPYINNSISPSNNYRRYN